MQTISRLSNLLSVVNEDSDALNGLIPNCTAGELSKALASAAGHGSIKSVRLLIPLTDPKNRESVALRNAAGNGHLEVVRALIPVSDPTAMNSRALRVAARNGHDDVLLELVKVSDVSQLFLDEVDKVLAIQTVESFQFINTLAAHVGNSERLQALNALSPQWIKKVPYLISWNHAEHDDRELEQAVPAATAKTGVRTRLGKKTD